MKLRDKPQSGWTKWQDITNTGSEQRRARLGMSAGRNEQLLRVVRNNLYHVIIYEIQSSNPSDPQLLHLSIKTHTQQAQHDWRHLQRIKNELVGPECEAVELFPADSRMVDTSNQFHLWAINDPVFRFPFGYNERLVTGADCELGKIIGSKQRPFEPHDPTRMDKIPQDVIDIFRNQGS